MKILILRPEPGADQTACRVREMGLVPVVSPLFEIVPLDWSAPDPKAFDAAILTSANAARYGGPSLAGLRELPCYAVGETTAEAARVAGLPSPRTGLGDGAALVRMMVDDGVATALHLCGRDHVPLGAPGIAMTHVPVYAAEARGALNAEAIAALNEGALVLLHSPRAAARFAELVDEANISRSGIKAAAISPAAAAAAGPGWALIEGAERSREEALLELARKLCKDGRLIDTGSGG